MFQFWKGVANMPLVTTKSQAEIIADYQLLQKICEKWRKSKTLAEIKPEEVKMYEVFNLPNDNSNGIVIHAGKYWALLSSEDNGTPYDFVEMVMRDMKEGDIVILFSKADYAAAKRCDNHINKKQLRVEIEN